MKIKGLLIIFSIILIIATSIAITIFDWQWGFYLIALATVLIIYAFSDLSKRYKPLKCRRCGNTGDMAIEYETDGVCRKCLDDILEAQGITNKGEKIDSKEH